MSEEMQADAVDCATQALEKYNIEKDIASYIEEFDKKYNPTWHCIVGRNFGCTLRMKLSISSTFTWARWPSSYSNLAEGQQQAGHLLLRSWRCTRRGGCCLASFNGMEWGGRRGRDVQRTYLP